ncbi:MAG: Kelch repeat-containing protein [Candidatus Limnocylindria bacterium]
MTRVRTLAGQLTFWLALALIPAAAGALVVGFVLESQPPAMPDEATSTGATPTQISAAPPPTPPSTPRPTPHPAARSEAASATHDGRLHLFGGRGAGGQALASVVTFEGTTWTHLPPMPEAAFGAAAVALDDGTLLVFGGLDDDGDPTDSTLILEPGGAEWSTGPPMPHPQAFPAVARVDGRVFLFGGSNHDYGDGVLVFDAGDETWSSAVPMPISVSHAAAAVVDGVVFLFGGRPREEAEPTPEVYRYDPDAMSWARVADMPLTGNFQTATVVDGLVWVIGGTAEPADRYPGVQSYDPATDTWAVTSDRLVPGLSWHAALALRDGGIIVIAEGYGARTVSTAGQ